MEFFINLEVKYINIIVFVFVLFLFFTILSEPILHAGPNVPWVLMECGHVNGATSDVWTSACTVNLISMWFFKILIDHFCQELCSGHRHYGCVVMLEWVRLDLVLDVCVGVDSSTILRRSCYNKAHFVYIII